MKRALLSMVIWVLCRGQEVPPQKTVSVCEVLRERTKYNGMTIAVRGVYTPWEHGLYLNGEGCEGMLVTKGFKWPSAISVVDRQDQIESRGRSISAAVRITEEIAAAIRRELQRKGRGAKAARVRLTYVGLFETQENFETSPGFGALNAAPGQLFVDSVKDIVVEFEENSKRQ